jgi:hypothetical protein
MADIKLEHAREFTDIENLTLDLWLQLENANLDDNARKVLDAGLMFEHYTSLLDSDANKRTQAEIQQQNQLNFKLQDEVRLAMDALKKTPTRAASRLDAAHERLVAMTPFVNEQQFETAQAPKDPAARTGSDR